MFVALNVLLIWCTRAAELHDFLPLKVRISNVKTAICQSEITQAECHLLWEASCKPCQIPWSSDTRGERKPSLMFLNFRAIPDESWVIMPTADIRPRNDSAPSTWIQTPSCCIWSNSIGWSFIRWICSITLLALDTVLVHLYNPNPATIHLIVKTMPNTPNHYPKQKRPCRLNISLLIRLCWIQSLVFKEKKVWHTWCGRIRLHICLTIGQSLSVCRIRLHIWLDLDYNGGHLWAILWIASQRHVFAVSVPLHFHNPCHKVSVDGAENKLVPLRT